MCEVVGWIQLVHGKFQKYLLNTVMHLQFLDYVNNYQFLKVRLGASILVVLVDSHFRVEAVRVRRWIQLVGLGILSWLQAKRSERQGYFPDRGRYFWPPRRFHICSRALTVSCLIYSKVIFPEARA